MATFPLAGHGMVIDGVQPRLLPEYYDNMYQDGYTPYEILEAKHRQLYNNAAVAEPERAARETDYDFMPTDVHFSTEVKIKR